jgi:hypothetical protein
VNPLIRVIPSFLVRFFASPYVAGDSLQKAVGVVQKLRRERGLWSTLDLLAEDIRTDEQAQQNLDAYLQMVDAAAALPAEDRPTLSLKPSSYTTKPMQHGGDGRVARGTVPDRPQSEAEGGRDHDRHGEPALDGLHARRVRGDAPGGPRPRRDRAADAHEPHRARPRRAAEGTAGSGS